MSAFMHRPARPFEPALLGGFNTLGVLMAGLAMGREPIHLAILALTIGIVTWRVGVRLA